MDSTPSILRPTLVMHADVLTTRDAAREPPIIIYIRLEMHNMIGIIYVFLSGGL